ncbi:MAG: hypothetical protein WDZ51_14995 [Pirellulaceae bacterium]
MVRKLATPTILQWPALLGGGKGGRFARTLLVIGIATISTCGITPCLAQGPAATVEVPVIVDSPAITSLRASDPQSPFELARAAQLALDLGRADVAIEFLTKLVADGPEAGALLDAHRRLGTAHFLRFQNNVAIQPVGTEVANRVLEAAANYAADPDRLARLVQQLGDGDSAKRRQASDELMRAGKHAANPLFEVLADPDQEDLHPRARVMLVELGQAIHGPLLAALESDSDTLVASVIQVCGAIRHKAATDLIVGRFGLAPDDSRVAAAAETALIQLAGNAPARHEVELYLRHRAQVYLRPEPMFAPDQQGEVEFWNWEEAQAVETRLPVFDAQVRIADRLLSNLEEISDSPLTPGLANQRLLARLQLAKLDSGLDTPLSEESLQAFAPTSLSDLEQALESALPRRELTPAAIAATEALAAHGDVSLLVTRDKRPSPLAMALESDYHQVRLAAALAILRLDPTRMYAGSSDVLRTLERTATAAGRRIVVIADPHQERATLLAGIVQTVGFEPVVVSGGSALFREAYRTIDVEFLLISENVSGPILTETLQILRKDRRTADLPIGVLADPETLMTREVQTAGDPRTLAMITPQDEEGFVFQAEQLLRSPGRMLVTAEQRLADAELAMTALAKLANQRQRYSFYDLWPLESTLLSRLREGALTEDVAMVLGYLGTPAAQQSLVEVASDTLRPLPQRQACVEAFTHSVESRGLLLTKDQILRQYDRYNGSETLGADTQTVLAQILDALEAPTKGVRFDQPAIAPENRE